MTQIDKTFLGASSLAVFVTGTITPVATAAASTVEQAFTVTGTPGSLGLLPTDYIDVQQNATSGNALGIAGSRVNTSGQLVIAFCNPTAGSLTWPAMTYTVLVVRP